MPSPTSCATVRRPNHRAAVNLWWLAVLVLFCVGLLGGGYWWKKSARPPSPIAAVDTHLSPAAGLTAVTQELLHRTELGVEIRFYRLLNDGPGSESLRAYAARAEAMVAEYARISEGRITVTSYTDAGSRAARDAALADGLTPGRSGRSESDLLGIVVSYRSDKVLLSPLDPKWEGALEFDLTRALARVIGASGSGELVVNPAPVNPEATAELRRILPELDSLPLAEARQQLHAVAREDFKTLVAEMQAELQAAQHRMAAGENAAAAREELQQLQVKQAEQLNEIPRRMQAQLELLARIKK